jgi:RNA polymerase sigma-70 factor (ECF subfamily)
MNDITEHFETEPEMQPDDTPPWPILVEKIRTGDPAAMEELYRVFDRGIRFYLCRQLGPQDLDDRVHDAFVSIAQSIRNGEVRSPQCLMGYVRTVVRRQVAAQIGNTVHNRRNRADVEVGKTLCDHRPDPERTLIQRQNKELALRILRSLRKRDRDVLTRFYLYEQPAERICHDMGLTETQFRLIKSRAKIRFGELGKASLSHRRASAV